MGDRRAVLCGYYGRGNAGDEALLAALLQMLPKTVEPLVLSADPAQTRSLHGVESYPSRSAFAILQALQAADYFIWGGGSLMQDTTSWRNPLYYGGLMAMAQQRGLKTIAWAQGVGPLHSPFTRWLTRQVLRGCTAISVRDRATAQLLCQWQLSPRIAPDPVWALAGKPLKGLWQLPAPRVAVTLRAHPLLTPQRLDTLIRALVNFQKATQTCILLVPFQLSQDAAIAHQIAAQLPGAHQVLSLSDPRELKGLFRGVEMAIGMRLHSLIMAAAAACRCFALSYDPKVSQLMAELNLPGWELAQLPNDANAIASRWLEHYANSEALSPIQIQALSDRALLHQELLEQVMNR